MRHTRYGYWLEEAGAVEPTAPLSGDTTADRDAGADEHIMFPLFFADPSRKTAAGRRTQDALV